MDELVISQTTVHPEFAEPLKQNFNRKRHLNNNKELQPEGDLSSQFHNRE